MKIIQIDFSTDDFAHAVKVCKVAFGYEGEEWERVKQTQDLDILLDFLESDDVDATMLHE
ncbi:hypothetical protein ACU3L3_07205 [Priestia endophytica]